MATADQHITNEMFETDHRCLLIFVAPIDDDARRRKESLNGFILKAFIRTSRQTWRDEMQLKIQWEMTFFFTMTSRA